MCTPLVLAAVAGGSVLQGMGQSRQANAIANAQIEQIRADSQRRAEERERQLAHGQQAAAATQASIDATSKEAVAAERGKEQEAIENRLLAAVASQPQAQLPGGGTAATPRVVTADAEKSAAATDTRNRGRAEILAALNGFDNVLRNQGERQAVSGSLVDTINGFRRGSLRASEVEGDAVATRGAADVAKAQSKGQTLRTIGDLLVGGGQLAGGAGWDPTSFDKLFAGGAGGGVGGPLGAPSLPVAM